MNALTPIGTPIGTPIETTLGTPRLRLPEALARAPAHLAALELRELRYFAAAARTGNLGRAARELNVTPPAISQQLRKLEDELGTQLLVRHSRGVTPTLAGACLLERIDAILRLLNAPLDLESAGAAIGGTVSIVVPAEIGAMLVAPLVEQVRRRWPDVTLDLQESAGGGIESRLLGRQVDIAVLQDPPDLDDLRIEPLLTEGLGLVASPSDALAGSSLPVRLRDLGGVPLILPNPRHWLRHILARAGFQRGIRIDAAFQVDSISMTKEMVRNRLGCTILPAVAVRDETARGALVFRPIAQPAISATQAIAARHDAAPVVRDVAQVMGDVIRSLAASGTWPGAQLLEPRGQDVPPEAWQLPLPEPLLRSVEFVEGD
ncbi:MAG TPA: LysR family transcriptional regulator [Acetobacteraceae bacterium]